MNEFFRNINDLIQRWLLLIVVAVSVVNCGLISEVAESAAYALLRQSILQAGKSKEYANCVEKVLKLQDPTKDFKENLFTPDRLLQHLKNELEVADFLCENQNVVIAGAIVLVILFILCICRICRIKIN